MSWLGQVGGSLSNITGQLTNLTKDILTETTNEVEDTESELKVAQERIRSLEMSMLSQRGEIDRLKSLNDELHVKSESTELQLQNMNEQYRTVLADKESALQALRLERPARGEPEGASGSGAGSTPATSLTGVDSGGDPPTLPLHAAIFDSGQFLQEDDFAEFASDAAPELFAGSNGRAHKLEQLQKENRKLRSEVDQWKRQAAKARKKGGVGSGNESSSAQAADQIQNLQEEIKNLNAQLESAQEQLREEATALQDAHEVALAKERKRVAQLRKDVQQLEQEKQELAAARNDLESRLAELHAQVDSLAADATGEGGTKSLHRAGRADCEAPSATEGSQLLLSAHLELSGDEWSRLQRFLTDFRSRYGEDVWLSALEEVSSGHGVSCSSVSRLAMSPLPEDTASQMSDLSTLSVNSRVLEEQVRHLQGQLESYEDGAEVDLAVKTAMEAEVQELCARLQDKRSKRRGARNAAHRRRHKQTMEAGVLLEPAAEFAPAPAPVPTIDVALLQDGSGAAKSGVDEAEAAAAAHRERLTALEGSLKAVELKNRELAVCVEDRTRILCQVESWLAQISGEEEAAEEDRGAVDLLASLEQVRVEVADLRAAQQEFVVVQRLLRGQQVTDSDLQGDAAREIVALKGQLSALDESQEAVTALDQENTSLQAMLGQLKDDCKSLKAEKMDMAEAIEGLRSRCEVMEQLRQQLSSFQTMKAQAEDEYESLKMEKLMNEEHLRREIEVLRSRGDSLDESQEAVIVLHKQNSNLQEEVKRLKTEMQQSDAREENERLRLQLEHWQTQVNAGQTEINRLQSEIEITRQEIEKLGLKLEAEREAKRELELQVESVTAECQRLQIRAEDTRRENERMQDEVDEMKEEVERMHIQVEDTNQESESLQHQLDHPVHRKTVDLESHRVEETLKKELDATKAEAERLRTDVVKMENELRSLRGAAVVAAEVSGTALESELTAVRSQLAAKEEELLRERAMNLEVIQEIQERLAAREEELFRAKTVQRQTEELESKLAAREEELFRTKMMLAEEETTDEGVCSRCGRELQQSSNSLHASGSSQSLQILEDECRQLRLEKEQMLAVMNDKSRESSQLRAEVARLMQVSTVERGALDKLQQDNHHLQEELAGRSAAPTDVDEEQEDMTRQALKNLSTLVRDKEVEIEALKEKNRSLMLLVSEGGTPESTGDVQRVLEEKESLCSQLAAYQHDREQLVAALNQKHAESLSYHAELQRVLGLLQKEQTATAQRLAELQSAQRQLEERSVALLQAHNEVAAARQRCTELGSKLERLGAESAAECSVLRKELEETRFALNEAHIQLEEQITNRSADQQAADRESRLQKELQRLREHLVQVEEGYTGEALAAETREKELRDRLTHAEGRGQTEALEVYLSRAEAERATSDEAARRAVAEATQAKQQLLMLQSVVERLESERASVGAMESERAERRARQAEADLETARRRCAEMEARLKEQSEVLAAAERLHEQLDKKEQLVAETKERANSTLREMEILRDKLREMTSSSEAKIDKELIRNLLLGYLTATATRKQEALRVVAALLSFQDADLQKVGLTPSRAGGRWLGWLRGNEPAPASPQLDSSFSQLFVKFLERESAPTPVFKLPTSRPTSAATSAASTPVRPTSQTIPTGELPPAIPLQIQVNLPNSTTGTPTTRDSDSVAPLLIQTKGASQSALNSVLN